MNRDGASPGSPSDEDLLARLQRGQREWFGELVRRYERELYSYLWRYLGDAELAADVFQNTCVAIFKKIKYYERGRAAKPWIYTVATNQAIDAMRQRARRREQVLPYAADGDDDRGETFFEQVPQIGPGPEEHAEVSEQHQRLRDALNVLNSSQRQVIVLTYFQGLKYQEAAEVLGIPLGTVKSRLNGAMAKLTAVWHEQNQPQDEAGQPT